MACSFEGIQPNYPNTDVNESETIKSYVYQRLFFPGIFQTTTISDGSFLITRPIYWSGFLCWPSVKRHHLFLLKLLFDTYFIYTRYAISIQRTNKYIAISKTFPLLYYVDYQHPVSKPWNIVYREHCNILLCKLSNGYDIVNRIFILMKEFMTKYNITKYNCLDFYMYVNMYVSLFFIWLYLFLFRFSLT